MNYSQKIFNKKLLLKIILFLPLLGSVIPLQINSVRAIEFQWDTNSKYKKLKWFQTNSNKFAKNKIFFIFRPSDRRTGLLKLNIKVPKTFNIPLPFLK